MVTLFCFCCDHRNPAGARFCNACGTPLHLKPCKHCDAINTRAAAHCHKCGETFALEFLALDDVTETPEAPEAAHVPAPVEATTQPGRQGVVQTRVVALVLGMAATALLSAYFAYRQPGIGPAAAIVEPSRPAVPAAALRPEASPLGTFAPAVASSPVPSSEPPGPAAGPAGKRAGAGVNDATRQEAAKVQTTSARPTAKRNEQVSAAKPKAEPSRRVARSTRSEPVVATNPAGVRPQVEDRSLPDPGPGSIALQAIVTPPAAPARSVPVEAPPAPPRRESARRPVSSPGAWDRPCAEGVALDSVCDVRTMPKGN
jgi:Double zinc ribbon